jgi:hypothetical protein
MLNITGNVKRRVGYVEGCTVCAMVRVGEAGLERTSGGREITPQSGYRSALCSIMLAGVK